MNDHFAQHANDQSVVPPDALLEAIPDAVVLTDNRGVIMQMNTRAEALFGYSRAEVRGQGVEMLFSARWRHAGTLAQSRQTALELEALTKHGLVIPIEMSSGLTRVGTGGSCVITTIRDVSAREQRERGRQTLSKIRISEPRTNLASVGQKIALLLRRADPPSTDGHVLAQPRAPEPPVLKSVSLPQALSIAPVFSDSESRPLILVVEDNADTNRLVCRQLASLFRTVSALDGEQGLRLAMELKPDLILTDIMMPRMTGDELIRQLRTRREFDTTPVIVFSARAEDSLRLGLLRTGAQDYLRKPCSMEELCARVNNLVSMKRVRDVLRHALDDSTEDVQALALEVTRKTRDLQAALETAHVARDLAERASTHKSNFLSLVSHELRTPLATLRLQLDALGVANLKAERRDVLLRRMNASYRRLADLIETLLNYSNAQAGRLSLQSKAFAVGDVAREVVKSLRDTAQSSVSLSYQEAGPIPLLFSDPLIVELVLSSLVSNALKVTPSGEVRITAEWHLNDGCRIGVTDTGPGIAVEDRARIFEPFERLHDPRAPMRPGLGLGLALTRELVLALGARIELESTVGIGSTFSLVLPTSMSNRSV